VNLGRWRTRAAIAVLAGVTVVAGGYLVAEYRSSPDEPVAAVAGIDPSGAVLPQAPSASAVVTPSASVPPSSKPRPKASTKSAAVRPPSQGGWPGPGNTGVPSGTRLANYSGPCTITKDRAVVSGKLIKCDALLVRARDVTISKSRIVGRLDTTEGTSQSFVLEDSEVDAGIYQGPAVGLTNMTIRRSNIHGGQANVLCYANCDIRDSWLHAPGLADGADWHLNGVLANDTHGSGSNVTLIHNTIECNTPQNSAGGGCSGDVSLFADFGPVSDVTIRGNLMGASPDISYCFYGGSSEKKYSSGVRNIVVEDNVFRRGPNRKCGAYGPVTSFDTKLPGNRWANNVWEDGSPIEAAN
jgi:hypothetical protein